MAASTSRTPKIEREPSATETEIIRSLLFDSLLCSQPLIRHNVETDLMRLLTQIGRPKLAAVVRSF